MQRKKKGGEQVIFLWHHQLQRRNISDRQGSLQEVVDEAHLCTAGIMQWWRCDVTDVFDACLEKIALWLNLCACLVMPHHQARQARPIHFSKLACGCHMMGNWQMEGIILISLEIDIGCQPEILVIESAMRNECFLHSNAICILERMYKMVK